MLRNAIRSIMAQHPSRRWVSTSTKNKRHLMAAIVVNQPGCLAQIANLFAARGYNIDSLVVGRTEVPELSRMTVVVNGTQDSVDNMKKQLEDLVHVALVDILTKDSDEQPTPFVERDLMLAKVSIAGPETRTQVVELANLFDAKVLDIRPAQLMLQLAGSPQRIESLVELLKPIGIVEIHRSGVIAMARSSAVHDGIDRDAFQGATQTLMEEDDPAVDATNLPPG